MKARILYILSIALAVTFQSCEDWLDVNTDPDSPSTSEMSENVYLPGIQGAVVFELTGGYPARVPNYWIGQIGRSATSPDYATFDIDESDVNNTWSYTLYSDALKNTIRLKDVAVENGNSYYSGIADVLTAYMLGVATDLWGDIPWSQAFQPEEYSTPVFDSQESIYAAIMGLLDEAVTDLNQPTDGQARFPGGEDLFYGGDIDSWIKLAYTLKARYAMHLTYAPGKTGAAQADIALAALANGFESNADNGGISYADESGAESPWNQWDVKWTVVYANEFILNLMQSKNDPRVPVYFDENAAGEFVGQINGTIVDEEDSVSHMSDVFKRADKDIYLITYDEAKFLEAEAYLWKNDLTNAQTSFEDAITSNMSQYGISNGAIASYLAGIGDLPADFESAQKMIIEEKYVANYLSLENWNDVRRTGYPEVSVTDFVSPTYNTMPLRFMYAADVKQNNSGNEPDVDWLHDPLWWDAK